MKKLLLVILLFCSVSLLKAGTQIKSDSLISKKDSVKEEEIFDRAEVMPTFPGGVVELMKFLSKNIHYPKLARENGLEGKVIVKFYIDVDGAVKEPEVLKDGVGGGAAEEAIRVITLMPNWSPGSQRGAPVKVYYTLPITFKLTNGKLNDNAPVISKMEPVFQGGNVQLEFYKQEILSRVKKSKKDKSRKITVEVMVTIDDLGKINNVIVTKSNTDNKNNIEIILAGIKSMPNWYPAMLNGKTVTSQKTLIFEY